MQNCSEKNTQCCGNCAKVAHLVSEPLILATRDHGGWQKSIKWWILVDDMRSDYPKSRTRQKSGSSGKEIAPK